MGLDWVCEVSILVKESAVLDEKIKRGREGGTEGEERTEQREIRDVGTDHKRRRKLKYYIL